MVAMVASIVVVMDVVGVAFGVGSDSDPEQLTATKHTKTVDSFVCEPIFSCPALRDPTSEAYTPIAVTITVLR